MSRQYREMRESFNERIEHLQGEVRGAHPWTANGHSARPRPFPSRSLEAGIRCRLRLERKEIPDDEEETSRSRKFITAVRMSGLCKVALWGLELDVSTSGSV